MATQPGQQNERCRAGALTPRGPGVITDLAAVVRFRGAIHRLHSSRSVADAATGVKPHAE